MTKLLAEGEGEGGEDDGEEEAVDPADAVLRSWGGARRAAPG